MQSTFTSSVQKYAHFMAQVSSSLSKVHNFTVIYSFLILQDTKDESRWQYLNKSLHRVSSTTNGKYDAMQEIEVSTFCLFP